MTRQESHAMDSLVGEQLLAAVIDNARPRQQ